jgi:GT2 family glycosyltransferase
MNDDNGLMASVIVVAHNDKKYLEGCLSSLLDQNMPAEKYEVIYADNASTDGSADFVAEWFPTVRVVRLDRNYGFAEGNNRAAAFARGRYIAFQNADTVTHRRWLPGLIKTMRDDPQVKGCHPAGLPLNFGGYNERESRIEQGIMCELSPFGYVDFTKVPLDGEPIPTLFIAGGSMMIDGEIVEQLEYIFDPTYFIYNEDTDLGLRINNLGYKVVFVPSAVAYHQRDPSRRVLVNKKSLRMALLVTRNRFITFYKNMHGLEFLLALPLLCVGSIAKVKSLNLGLARRTVYALGLVPYTLLSLAVAVRRFRRYAAQRRHILSNRQRERFWLLKELWKRQYLSFAPLQGD